MSRDAQSVRMGFAWEEDELADMSYDEAVGILKDNNEALAAGSISNEDARTIEYAKQRVANKGEA